MKSKFKLLMVLITCMFSVVALAGKVVMPEMFYQVKNDLVTPHIPWAKPYYKGKKLKALVFAPRFRHRETVELIERMDIECTPILLYNEREIYLTGWNWGLENVARVKKDAVLSEINRALEKDYDVIIMGKVATQKMPKDILKKIEDKVRNGAGLIYVYYGRHPNTDFEKHLTKEKTQEGRECIVNGIPFEQLKGFRIRGDKNREKDLERLLSLYKSGKGKVAFIDYPVNSTNLYLTPNDPEELTYEYYQSFIIKTVLWSAQKEANILFKNFPINIKAKELSFNLVKTGGPPPSRLSARISIRTSKQLFRIPAKPVIIPGVYQTASKIKPVYQKTIKITKIDSAKDIKFEMPDLPKGEYFVDVEILSGDKKVNWATATVSATPKVYISELKCTPEVIDCKEQKNQQIKVMIKFNTVLAMQSTLKLTLIDNFERVLTSKQIILKEGAKNAQGILTVNTNEIVSALLNIRAELYTDKQNVKSIETVNITTIHRTFPKFTFFAWGGADGNYVANQVLRANASLGVVDAYRTKASLTKLKISDMRFVPDITRLLGIVKNTGVMSHPKPFWGNIKYRRKLYKQVKKSVKSGLKFDTYAHLLGDEMALMNQPADICAGNIEDFRQYLKQQYKTIDLLNKEWNASYNDFKDIKPITRKDMQAKAVKDKDYAALIDLWMFNYWVFADTIRLVKKIKDELDPLAKIGASTPLWNWWWRGYYWEKITLHLDFFTPYYRSIEGDVAQVESSLSFGPNTAFSGHAGSYVYNLTNTEYYTVLPQAMLLKGFSNFFWYYLYPGTEGSMSPSLDQYPQTLNTVREVKRIKSGLGKLILEAKQEKRKIAVLYSTSSYLFSFLVSNPYVSWNANYVVINLHRLGYQVDFVSSEQVENGKLSEYKALFLPVVQGVSDKEAAKIKDFVKSGGLVVADVRPGIADEHGKKRVQGAFTDMFGVKWNKPLKTSIQKLEMIPKNNKPEESLAFKFAGTIEGQQFGGPMEKLLWFDPSLELNGAKSCINYSVTKESINKLKNALKKIKTSNKKERKAFENRIKLLEGSKKNIPFITYNRYGKGLAVCLNTPFTGMPLAGSNVFEAVLTSFKIQPPVVIEKGCGDFLPGKWIPTFEFNKFNDGVCSYYGVVKFKNDEIENAGSNAYYGVVKSKEVISSEKGREYKIIINLKKKAYVYEPLTGKYLGFRKNITDIFGAWEARWYSVLPYKVEGLKVSFENENSSPGKPIKGNITVLTGGIKPQRHVINIQILDKNGKSAIYLQQNLNTKNGKVEFAIPTAFNDNIEEWTLIFKDAATGITKKCKL